MTEEKTLIEDVIHDIDFSRKLLEEKRKEIVKIEADIKYYQGMIDGSNNTLSMIKKHFEVK